MEPCTILDRLEYHALRQPDTPALVFLLREDQTVTLSYADLVGRARSLAAHLQAHAASGDRALLAYGFEPHFLIAFFACLYAGIIAVPAYAPRSARKLDRLSGMVASARPTLCLTTLENRDRLVAQDLQNLQNGQLGACAILATDAIADQSGGDLQFGPGNASNIAFLQYTSGSTTAPRGVAISHANLVANLEMCAGALNVTAQTPLLGWTPLFHDFGLIFNVLQPLFAGATAILLPPVQFVQKPLRWLQAMSDFRVVISGGPNFAYDYCVRHIDEEMTQGLDLSHWSIALNAAEPVCAATMDRFARKFAHARFDRAAFFPAYGMAEATVFACAGRVGQGYRQVTLDNDALKKGVVRYCAGDQAAKRVVNCGHARLAGEILVVDPRSGARLAAGTPGEIWMRGPHVPAFYWNAPAASAETFQAWLDTGNGPYLRTGDLGFQDAAGDLYVLGRLKDMLIIRGQNHYPQDIERTVEAAHPALQRNACAAFSIDGEDGEELVVAIEVRRSEMRHADWPAIVRAVRAAISAMHELSAMYLVLLKPMAIPKTSSDKIQRSRCRQLFLDGLLTPLHLATAQGIDMRPGASCDALSTPVCVSGASTREIEAYLMASLAQALRRGLLPADAATSFPELGMDSLAMQEALMGLNDWLGISVSITDVFEHCNVQLMALHATGLLKEKQAAAVRSVSQPASN